MTATIAPPLTGRRVRLRAVMPVDHEYLFALASHPDVARAWRYRGAPPPFEEFVRDLWQGTLVHFVVERRDGGQRIGYVQAFEASERHGWCYVATMLDPALVRSGWAVESMALFVDYVFRMWNFHRVYAVALDSTYLDVSAGEGRFFVTEGCMKEHEWVDGRHADLYFLTVPRDLWQRHGSPLVARLTATPAKEGA